MKFTAVLVIGISQLVSSLSIKDFAGKGQVKVYSPEDYINLGQLQVKEHNEALSRHGGYYKAIPTLTPKYFTYVPLKYIGAESAYLNPIYGEHAILTKRHFLPLNVEETLISPAAGRVSSPEHTITVGSLNNANQAGISKE